MKWCLVISILMLAKKSSEQNFFSFRSTLYLPIFKIILLFWSKTKKLLGEHFFRDTQITRKLYKYDNFNHFYNVDVKICQFFLKILPHSRKFSWFFPTDFFQVFNTIQQNFKQFSRFLQYFNNFMKFLTSSIKCLSSLYNFWTIFMIF